MKFTYLLIGILLGMAVIITIALYSNARPPVQYQYIKIDGHLINYDHIVDVSKLNDHLHIWTSCPTTWKNGMKSQYRNFKLTKDLVNEYYFRIAARRSRN